MRKKRLKARERLFTMRLSEAEYSALNRLASGEFRTIAGWIRARALEALQLKQKADGAS